MKFKMLVVLGIMFVLNFGVVQGSFADSNPLFVTITAKESCSTCKKFEPTLQELQDEYDGRITFVTLDLSSKDSIEEAKRTAEEVGITKFFEENRGVVPKVGILCPGGTKTESIFLGETRKEVFEEALDKALLDISTVCSL